MTRGEIFSLGAISMEIAPWGIEAVYFVFCPERLSAVFSNILALFLMCFLAERPHSVNYVLEEATKSPL